MTATENQRRPELLGWNPAEELSVLEYGRARVWIVELDQPSGKDGSLSFDAHSPRFAALSEEEVARASRFVRPRDRVRFARCRSALRQILGGILTVAPDRLKFRHIGAGKPELDPSSTLEAAHISAELRFNVSHSANLALIAVCRGRELGVDIEQVRAISEAERIVASYFTPAEQAEFAAIPPHLKDQAFHRGWTRKEAIIKAEGSGLAGLAHSFETHFGPNELTAEFELARPFPRINRWILWEATPASGFVAALAIDASA